MNDLPYYLISRMFKILMRLMRWVPRVEGADHVPLKGPALLAVNHFSFLDWAFVDWATIFQRGRYVRFLAKKGVFDHLVAGPFMKGMHHIPVDRARGGTALRGAVKALKAGEVVGLFPEGTVNPTYAVGKARTGTVRIAQISEVPVIPVAVWGGQRLFPKGRKPSPRPGVAIILKFGEPLTFDKSEDPRPATVRLMQAIAGLLAKAQAEYPQKPRSEDDKWWMPAHLGGTAPQAETFEPL